MHTNCRSCCMSAIPPGDSSLVTGHSDLLRKSAVAERADGLLREYREIIGSIPPEAGFGGIWESEMFLFYAAVKPFAPKQILESGRARGKSTLVLARCFPDARIVSVEYDRQSENAAAAEAKLKLCSNVELLYGDSREILPGRLQPGDAVLIDDPLFRHFQNLDAERDPRPNPQRRYGIFVCLPPPLPMAYWKLRFRLLTHSKVSV